jgi:hypothetical protein
VDGIGHAARRGSRGVQSSGVMAHARGGRKPARERRRVLVVAALAILVAAAASLLVLAHKRHELAQGLVLSALRARDLSPASVAVTRLDLSGIELRRLQIGREGDLRIAEVDVDYSAAGLVRGQLDALRVAGLRLRATLDQRGLSLGALDPLLRGESGGGESGAVVLPVGAIAVEDGRIELDTPYGPLEMPIELRLDTDPAGHLQIHADIAARHALASGSLQADVTGGRESIQGEIALRAEADGVVGPGLALAGAGLEVRAEVVYRDGAIEVRVPDCIAVRIQRFDLADRFTLAAPVALCVKAPEARLLRVSVVGDRLAEVIADLGVEGAPFELVAHAGTEALRVEGVTPRIDLHGEDLTRMGRATLRTRGGRISLPDYALVARGVEVDASLDLETRLPTGTLRVREVSDARRPARFADLALEGRIAPEGSGLAFDLALSAAGGALELTFAGGASADASSGQAAFEGASLAFEPEGLQPADLVPALKGIVSRAAGTVEARGAIRWEGSESRGGLDLALLDLSASTPFGEVEQVGAALHLDGPPGLSSPPGQRLSFGRAALGVHLSDGRAEYQLQPDGTLDLQAAEWGFAGGRIRTQGKLDPGAEEQSLVFEVEGVDLAQLLAVVDLDGLSGSGEIRGRIPIARRGPVIEIRDARLEATEVGGVVRYRPGGSARGIASVGGDTQTVMEILDDFHYERLQLDVNGDAFGEVVVALKLYGANPAFQGGQLVDYNLKVEAHLADLVRTGAAAYKLPEKIQERIGELIRGAE